MSEKLIFNCTYGKEEPERATLPFVAANIAATAGQDAVVLLTIEAVWLGTDGGADGIAQPGLPVLDVAIGLMRCPEGIGRDALHAPMYVHELRHRLPLSTADGRSVAERSIEPRSSSRLAHAKATVLAPAMTSSTTLAAPTMTDPLQIGRAHV